MVQADVVAKKDIIKFVIISTIFVFPVIWGITTWILSSISPIKLALGYRTGLFASWGAVFAFIVIALIWKATYSKSYGKEISKGVFVSGSIFFLCALISSISGDAKLIGLGSHTGSLFMFSVILFPILNFVLSKTFKDDKIREGIRIGYTYMFLLIPVFILSVLSNIE